MLFLSLPSILLPSCVFLPQKPLHFSISFSQGADNFCLFMGTEVKIAKGEKEQSKSENYTDDNGS